MKKWTSSLQTFNYQINIKLRFNKTRKIIRTLMIQGLKCLICQVQTQWYRLNHANQIFQAHLRNHFQTIIMGMKVWKTFQVATHRYLMKKASQMQSTMLLRKKWGQSRGKSKRKENLENLEKKQRRKHR